MKRFILSICFIAFLSAGLVSCNDEAAEVTPNFPDSSVEFSTVGGEPTETGNGPTKP